ncbi:polymorphic toxin-type HINT domain-containing protein [Streptomyces shenzhenensis]|uniref:polymorphic toxin-type HINT domain-containing protein n=1 Tax=Streptomyces shenzhenensis TaxID=943815 RepID=UPI00215DC212|nr:polymorphic toxin-type HINT domain-containing protein [Streptomyces shenzhenensis]
MGSATHFYHTWADVHDIPENPCAAGTLCDMAPLVLTAAGLEGACSFSPDTPVLMDKGNTKPIGKIKSGDKVESADPKTGKHVGPRTVQHVWINNDDDLLDLTIRAKDGHTATLHTTANHPFWNDTTHGWVPAGKLHRDDALNTAANGHVYVVATRRTQGAANRWNLTVQHLHTYYVLAGTTPVLVHNTCGDVELGPGINSADAMSAFTSPKPETEFVFDASTGKFLAGDRERIPGGLSPHEQLADSIGADKNTVLGGTIFRDDGRLVFTENSGHYGHRWTDATRQQFQEFLNSYGIQYDYRPWG